MCLAIPARVCEVLGNNMVKVEITGVVREADTSLLSEEVKEGDYVLVHTGFCISKLDEEQAKEDLKLWDELLLE
ncbi:MAG: HypC/HybG/HupF family hydrogenase formation chaperone [Candidatus Heimdallarchaeum aukensis]|uniref:HypC/HybG/HupF family hydrogenase formation chaperone n=1 Tax=Candidatus Heimdallarchaeum aukensis TaxID=2876573 RepID=A0A9Y1BJV9_9ARCH|nr:MAG: HypC/HybG/HupF family hydrogenase formation chaperone [Candidatus Heimdallarchaeum aukensis]